MSTTTATVQPTLFPRQDYHSTSPIKQGKSVTSVALPTMVTLLSRGSPHLAAQKPPENSLTSTLMPTLFPPKASFPSKNTTGALNSHKQIAVIANEALEMAATDTLQSDASTTSFSGDHDSPHSQKSTCTARQSSILVRNDAATGAQPVAAALPPRPQMPNLMPHFPHLNTPASPNNSVKASHNPIAPSAGTSTFVVHHHHHHAPPHTGLRLNKFVRRLHDMLVSEKDSGIVEWRRGLLVLHSTDAFAKKILPQYFNTRNFKTFRRQLNYYGFVHVRSFNTTGSSTTALWVNQELAQHGNDDVSSVLMLRRVEPCDAAKTAEGRRERKEQAIHTVEDDLGVNAKSLQMEQIRAMAIRGQDVLLQPHSEAISHAPKSPNATSNTVGANSQASQPSFIAPCTLPTTHPSSDPAIAAPNQGIMASLRPVGILSTPPFPLPHLKPHSSQPTSGLPISSLLGTVARTVTDGSLANSSAILPPQPVHNAETLSASKMETECTATTNDTNDFSPAVEDSTSDAANLLLLLAKRG